MKKQNLLTKLFLLCALVAGSTNVWGQDYKVVYTFATAANSSNTDYAKTYDVKIGDLNWNVPGNQSTAKELRLGGGKSGTLDKVDRVITGKSTIDEEISKITLNHKGVSSDKLTVNSITLTVASDDSFTKDVITKTVSSLSISKNTEGSIDLTPDQPCPAKRYYKITVNISNTEKKNYAFVVSSIVFYKSESVTKHTLSSAVSPAGVGTVTLSTSEVGEGQNTTISATATNAAYKFKNWTVVNGTVADANAASTTFTMGTVGDATVTANFEEKAKSTVTITSSADGTITVKNGDDVVASGNKIYEGATLTITAEAGANKEFASWSVTGAMPASTTENPTTLTVGTDDITIAANFNAITTHAISWSVNGTLVKTENIKEGNAITFAAPESGIPAGYVYKGWVEEANKIDTPTNADPKGNYITSATSTKDITYYCVMAKEEGTPVAFKEYRKVTTAQEDWSGTYILGATYSGGSDDSQKGTWIYSSPANSKKYGEKEAIGELTTEKADYEIVIDKSTNGYTIYHPKSKLYFAYNGSNNELNFAENVSEKKQEWSITDVAVIKNAASTSRVLKYNGSSPRFACYTSGQETTDLYKRIEDGGTTYTGFCTTVPGFEVTVPSAEYATFSDNVARDFSASGITVYTAKATGKSVTLTEVTDGIVPANTGVVLYKEGGTASAVSIPAVATAKTELDDNEMVANVTAGTVKKAGDAGKTNYILAKESAGVGFYLATDAGATLAANRAYLSTEITTASAREFLGFGDDDITTGIQSIDNSQLTIDNYYNLNGQRVAQPKKGLYIVNGRKVVVK